MANGFGYVAGQVGRAEADTAMIQCLAVTPTTGRDAVLAEVARRVELFTASSRTSPSAAAARNPPAAAWASVRDDLVHARWRP